jgi:predicted cobalt transporter CbtA
MRKGGWLASAVRGWWIHDNCSEEKDPSSSASLPLLWHRKGSVARDSQGAVGCVLLIVARHMRTVVAVVVAVAVTVVNAPLPQTDESEDPMSRTAVMR